MPADNTPDTSEIEALHKRVAALEAEIRAIEKENKRLLRQEAVLHATLDATTNGILAVDDEGKVMVSNRQFTKMWRIPPDLMDTGNDNELLEFVLDQLEEPDGFLARVRELYGSVSEEVDILRFRDGRVVERYSQPLVCGDKVQGRVWSFRDITPSSDDQGDPASS